MGHESAASGEVTRAILEHDLMENFHWLPQEIAEIPYRKLQMYYLISRVKHDAQDQRRKIQMFKDEQKPMSGRGQAKRSRG